MIFDTVVQLTGNQALAARMTNAHASRGRPDGLIIVAADGTITVGADPDELIARLNRGEPIVAVNAPRFTE